MIYPTNVQGSLNPVDNTLDPVTGSRYDGQNHIFQIDNFLLDFLDSNFFHSLRWLITNADDFACILKKSLEDTQ